MPIKIYARKERSKRGAIAYKFKRLFKFKLLYKFHEPENFVTYKPRKYRLEF